jgi:nicotinamide-nucleotide amidase
MDPENNIYLNMIAEILTTGDEIRSGALVDSNSAYIARKLEESGIEVVRHSCVGDELENIVALLKEISRRADIAVVTGGLGPTADDLTAAAAAAAAGVQLVQDPVALESVQKIFQARNRLLDESNKRQAMIPAGAQCLGNPIGTAPGFRLKIEKCVFYFLPGVPAEMQRMLSESVISEVTLRQGVIRPFRTTKTIATFGLTESATAEHLSGFESLFPQIRIGFRARFPIIEVKLYISGREELSIQKALNEASQWIHARLGNRIFSDTGDPMEKVVGTLLRRVNQTVAVAESCTGGLIANLLTNVPGSSDYFLFSAVTYSNETKMKILDVSADTLRKLGAVDVATAKEMAQGVRQLCGATYGLSTSGIAGPGGGTAEKPIGTLCIGLATPRSVTGRRFNFAFNDRWMNKQIFAITALDLLRRELLGKAPA